MSEQKAICRTCQGKKTITVATGDGKGEAQQTCPECKGTGKSPLWKK